MATALFRAATWVGLLAFPALSQTVFLSEIHYDNTGIDSDENVEVTGPAGTDLAGWSIPLYNGKDGAVYSTIALSGTIADDTTNGFRALSFATTGLQNGSPDGLALVDADGTVVQFLSYEGTFTATDGPAMGVTSEDIGISEPSTTPIGQSLQLTGTGSTYTDFSWSTATESSFGTINTGMSFCADGIECPTPAPTPAPAPAENLCDGIITAISAVQGSGTATPFSGTSVVVKGTVTAVFGGLDGFFMQDAGDGDSTTSDGIFVNTGDPPSVSAGDEVAVVGTAEEYYDNTQISVSIPGTDMEVCSTGNTLPTAVDVTLPSDEATLESLEGMLVSVKSPVVTENYSAGQYGEISLAAERQWQFTQVNSPGTVPTVPVGTTIILDDGSSDSYPNPDVYVDQAPDIRIGQTLNDVEGILHYSFSSYRVQPTTLGVTVADETNARPTNIPAASSSGNVRVASFNVLNYFTTLGSRGADTEQDREDQLAKITAGAVALNADVIGIIEVENDYDATTPSIQVIAESINAQDDSADWRYVVPSMIPLGADDIAVGILYNANVIVTKGASDVLDYGDDKTRASLAQTFNTKCGIAQSRMRCLPTASTEARRECLAEYLSGCPAFTMTVNHFKSKGSDCDDIGDPDENDGQGNCNLTRKAAMAALLAWVSGTEILVSPDDDILLTGDFNSYAMEDPIQTAINGGFVNMASSDPDYPRVSSYVYFGESGTLDYILASKAIELQRAGNVVHYHANSDETSALEYDNCNANDACTIGVDQYRSSDHDMVVQDFELAYN